MSSIENVLRGADADAASLGHAIVWTTIDGNVARGRCSGCGRNLVVASSEDGLDGPVGRALQESCTHDHSWTKPSLQRSGESPPNARTHRGVSLKSSSTDLH